VARHQVRRRASGGQAGQHQTLRKVVAAGNGDRGGAVAWMAAAFATATPLNEYSVPLGSLLSTKVSLANCLAVIEIGPEVVSVMPVRLVSPLSELKYAATMATVSLTVNEMTEAVACTDSACAAETLVVLMTRGFGGIGVKK